MGRMAYALFDKYTFQFRQQMRQAGDALRFSEQVARQAVARLTTEDWTEWRQQSFSGMDPTRQEAFRNATLLATTNDRLVDLNQSRMAAVGTQVHRIVAINQPPSAAEANSKEAHGLENTLDVAVGGRVILTRNLWTPMNLVNGATGTVSFIIYNEDNTIQMPDAIIVQFDKYRGPSCLPSEERMVAIRPETVYWQVNRQSCSRRMFPLQPAYGLTIHRAQGMTLDKVLLDLGQCMKFKYYSMCCYIIASGNGAEFSNGLFYTGLTRVRRLQDLAFFPKMPSLGQLNSTKPLESRSEEDKKKKKLAEALRQRLVSGQEPTGNFIV